MNNGEFMSNDYYPFVNLPLPYFYNAMEPFIDEKTMTLHHDKHLQTYINNLNDVLKDRPRLQRLSLEQLIRRADQLPEDIQSTVRNNAGGVYSHRLYFDLLKNPSEGKPMGPLGDAINQSFGGYEAFQGIFSKTALSVFGSGYVWLVSDTNGLRILTTPNQNTPIAWGLRPILLIDVWEHAYYLLHYNVRADYIKDWFHVVNWEQANNLFMAR